MFSDDSDESTYTITGKEEGSGVREAFPAAATLITRITRKSAVFP
jgi:hypothetical protein